MFHVTWTTLNSIRTNWERFQRMSCQLGTVSAYVQSPLGKLANRPILTCLPLFLHFALDFMTENSNGCFDWLISEYQSVNPWRKAISVLSGRYKRFTYVHAVITAMNISIGLKADFLSWQKSLAYSLQIFADNFSLLATLQRALAAWLKVSSNLLFAASKCHVTIQ